MNNLANGVEKRKLTQLREAIKEKFDYKNQSQKPGQNGNVGHEITICVQRNQSRNQKNIRETAWIDEPNKFIPNSYTTRARDNVDAPRDLLHFKGSFKLLKCSEIPAITRSFHLEYLNRSLNSRSKHKAKNLADANAFCVHCTDIATSLHVLNDCILAKLTQKVITKFCEHKGFTQNLLADETYLSYIWWEPKIMDFNTYKEIWMVWVETRKHVHQVNFLPRFNRFGPLQFAAKTATAFRKAAKVAHFNRLKMAHLPRTLPRNFNSGALTSFRNAEDLDKHIHLPPTPIHTYLSSLLPSPSPANPGGCVSSRKT